MDNGHQIDVIYTDYSKAFAIAHNILFNKLARIGIRGELSRRFLFCINNRSRAVVVNKQLDYYTKRVPQGSLLGPLLFNIFIKEIRNSFRYTNLLSFADDIKIYAKSLPFVTLSLYKPN